MNTINAQFNNAHIVQLMDLLVKSRPTDQNLKDGDIGSIPSSERAPGKNLNLSLEDQQELLSIAIEMKRTDQFNLAGFKKVLPEEQDDINQDQTIERYLAWGSWLMENMFSIQQLVYPEFDLDAGRYETDPEAIDLLNSSSDMDYCSEILYDRAIQEFSHDPSAFQPSSSMYRLFCDMNNDQWFREMEDLRSEYYKLESRSQSLERCSNLDACNRVDEFLCKDSIDTYVDIWDLDEMHESKVSVDLGVYHAHRYRIALGNPCSTIAPLLYEKDDEDIYVESGWSDIRADQAIMLQLEARRKLFVKNGGKLNSQLYWNMEERREDYGEKEEKEEMEAELLPAAAFALDPNGFHHDHDMFFGFQIGHLERSRYTSDSVPHWERTQIPVAAKFDHVMGTLEGVFIINPAALENYLVPDGASTEAVLDLFPNNAYARCIETRPEQLLRAGNMANLGLSLCLRDGSKACRRFYVAERFEECRAKGRFMSYDVHRPELRHQNTEYIRKENSVLPGVQNHYSSEPTYDFLVDHYVREHYAQLRGYPEKIHCERCS